LNYDYPIGIFFINCAKIKFFTPQYIQLKIIRDDNGQREYKIWPKTPGKISGLAAAIPDVQFLY
jgi:hypothetical protein